MTKEYDVLAVGNAIVDILGKVDDNFLDNHGLAKGSMILAEEDQIKLMYANLNNPVEKSGGSAANTMAGIASLGGKSAFIGKVKNDDHGEVFSKDLNEIGVAYSTKKAEEGAITAQSMIAITPDAERTMVTYLGATRNITKEDIDENLVSKSKILYLEGYLWDEEHAKDAMKESVEYAKKHGCKVSFSLSDAFCVERHREEFLELINNDIDILFCNMDELKSLFETDDENEAIDQITGKCEISAVTKGALGSIVIGRNGISEISPTKGINVVDTTGAGDLYASGFLYGYVNEYSEEECGKLANLTSSSIIQHVGARPQESLRIFLNK